MRVLGMIPRSAYFSTPPVMVNVFPEPVYTYTSQLVLLIILKLVLLIAPLINTPLLQTLINVYIILIPFIIDTYLSIRKDGSIVTF